jgi:cobalt/nickel transport system permease protein
MTEQQTIHLAGYWLPLLGCGVILCSWLAMRALRRMITAQQTTANEQIPTIDADASGTSLIHRWDPRFKIIALLGFAFCAVSLQSPRMVLGALLLAIITVAIARLPWHRSLRRLLAMNGFLVMFMVVMPLTVPTHPGDTLVVFGSWQLLTCNLRGLELALIIIGKAWCVALLMEPLLATAPLGATLEGLTRLGLPGKISEMLLIAHRYLFVFLGEVQRMRSGMEARAFRPGRRWDSLRDLGNFVGMLLVRSFERTHRVYAAMQARGYTGRLPHHHQFRGSMSDWLQAMVWLGLGLGLVLADRLTIGGF